MATPDITAILASLLSQNATNPYANINTPVIRPPVIPNTPWTGASGSTPPVTTVWGTPKTTTATTGGEDPEDPSGSGRGGTGPGGNTYGAMTAAQRSTLGNIATALGVAGWANPGLAAVGYSIRGALANDKYGITSRAGEVGITENDVRDAMDYGGAYAARDKESQRQEQESRKAAALESFSTPTSSITGGPKAPGETPESPTDVESGANKAAGETPDSPTDTESGGNSGGGPGGGAGGGPGSGGQGDPGGDASGQGGQGESGFALGGVKRFTKPSRPLVAEAGHPETGIFIPQMMEKMGMQGREQEVIRALKTMLQILEGSKRSTRSESPKAERKEHANGGRGQ